MWKTSDNNKEIWKIPSFQNHAIFFLISFPCSQALYAVYFFFLWFLFLNFFYFPSALPIILSSPFNNPLFPNPLSSCSLLFNSLVLALYPAVNSKTDTTDIYGGRIYPFNPTTNHTHVRTAHAWSIETVAFPLRVAYKPCIDWVAQLSFNLCADTVAYSTSKVNTPQLGGKGLTTEDIEERMERVCQSNSNRCVANWINTWKQEKEEKDTEPLSE